MERQLIEVGRLARVVAAEGEMGSAVSVSSNGVGGYKRGLSKAFVG